MLSHPEKREHDKSDTSDQRKPENKDENINLSMRPFHNTLSCVEVTADSFKPIIIIYYLHVDDGGKCQITDLILI